MFVLPSCLTSNETIFIGLLHIYIYTPKHKWQFRSIISIATFVNFKYLTDIIILRLDNQFNIVCSKNTVAKIFFLLLSDGKSIVSLNELQFFVLLSPSCRRTFLAF